MEQIKSPMRTEAGKPSMLRGQKLLFVDFLRGVAILLVVLTHVKGMAPNCLGVTEAILSFGRMGVQLFFVVSAFTLYVSWNNKKNEPGNLWKFYMRRYFRIAPMYYFGIVFYCAWAAYTTYLEHGWIKWPLQFGALSVITNVFLVHGFYPPGNNNVVPGGWSIATEFLFYVIFPLLVTFLDSAKLKVWTVFVALYLVALLSINYMISTRGYVMSQDGFEFKSIFNQLPVFLLGLSGARYLTHYGSRTPVLLDAIIGGVSFLTMFMIWHSEQSVLMSVIPVAAGTGFVAVLFIASKVNDKIYSGILKPVCLIGRISFSMYVVHFFFMYLAQRFMPASLLQWKEASVCLVYLAIVLATAGVSCLTERWIETPGILLGKRAISGMAAKLAASPKK